MNQETNSGEDSRMTMFNSMQVRLAKRIGLCCLLLLPSLAMGQLPELTAATGSGSATSAQFFAGVTADDGQTYGSEFAFDEVIDVLTEIRVEAAHVNTVGNLYLIILWDNTYFMGLEDGSFAVWDLAVETLQPVVASKTFAELEPLPIVQDVAFGPAGVSDTSLQIFLAYDTVAEEGELYYTATPLTFSIAAEATQAQSLTLYQNNISGPIIQNTCRTCHVQGGIAGATPLLYGSDQQANYNTLVNYILAGGGTTLLSKPSGGMGHGGGVQLAVGSDNYQNFSDFIDAVLSE